MIRTSAWVTRLLLGLPRQQHALLPARWGGKRWLPSPAQLLHPPGGMPPSHSNWAMSNAGMQNTQRKLFLAFSWFTNFC